MKYAKQLIAVLSVFYVSLSGVSAAQSIQIKRFTGELRNLRMETCRSRKSVG